MTLHNNIRLVAIMAVTWAACGAQEQMPAEARVTQLNAELAQRNFAALNLGAQKNAVVFVGDTVMPLVVDGGGWRTSITLSNLDTKQLHAQILFFQQDGTDLTVPISGTGSVKLLDVTLPLHSSSTFDTSGTASMLTTGWAFLLQDSPEDVIGGQVAVRERLSSATEAETIVPILTAFDSHFLLLLDNQGGYDTFIAFINPSLTAVTVSATIRNQNGDMIDQQSVSVGPFSRMSIDASQVWPSTAGLRGSIEFTTTGFGVSVIGLRFNPAGTLSGYLSLSNLDWLTQ